MDQAAAALRELNEGDSKVPKGIRDEYCSLLTVHSDRLCELRTEMEKIKRGETELFPDNCKEVVEGMQADLKRWKSVKALYVQK